MQSGKPVGVFRTHEWAPRVLIANSLLVPRWATWEKFRELEALGLTMYGQMTAGSWIYIGTQGILQGTYETFAAVAKKHFGGSLKGRLVVTAGLGGMGGAQPMAITMNEGVALVVEVDASRMQRRQQQGFLDDTDLSLDDALRHVEFYQRRGEPRTTIEGSREWASWIPGAEFVILPGAHHAAPREAAPAWNAAVQKFLDSHGLGGQ